MIEAISYAFIFLGIFFWYWGTSFLPRKRTILYKLHTISVSDTLGSIAIIVGLLLRIPHRWPLLTLAILSLALWNTMMGYVLAYCSSVGADQAGVKAGVEYD